MPHFQKRGNRIRASDKALVFRFLAGSLLLLFLAMNATLSPSKTGKDDSGKQVV